MAEPLTRVDSAVQGLPESPTEKLDITKPLTRVDSAVQGLSESPPKAKASHRRASSSITGLLGIKEAWESRTKLQVAPETQKTGWKINTSPSTVEDKEILQKSLVTPIVKSIDLVTRSGLVMTARNKFKKENGVTIKDALDAIHKINKKRADDELDEPYLAGFEWVPEHTEYDEEKEKDEMEKDWQRLVIHLSATPGVSNFGGKKKKKAAAE
ncbi:uncharacterized protein F4812DRAFT_454966 [Daldinia caldariorum]|uniref:uncharacterized protein n=1 Tax=Daldinia caldariorum TaxID=326644 RepID=UPI002007F61A|nr:uncharacterized protein F4812DRAFT_454966 [Daldinia caldariorum]KAI1473150.1 hypothetical protein F4812DRAFT_454966 [Daldinia caldariorum]